MFSIATESQKLHNKKVQSILKELPWYVEEYIDHKRRNLSAASLLNYCLDYKIFFNWIVSEQLFVGHIRDIPLSLLDTLKTQQVNGFLYYLKYELSNKDITINRKLSALKSLFNYLHNIAEDW